MFVMMDLLQRVGAHAGQARETAAVVQGGEHSAEFLLAYHLAS